MFFTFVGLVDIFGDIFVESVDEETSEKLEVWAHSIAILPAICHYFVDFIGTTFGLRQPLSLFNEFVDLRRKSFDYF